MTRPSGTCRSCRRSDYAPGHGWGVINGVLPPGGELLTGSADMEAARDNLYNNNVPFNRADETGATREQHQWLDSVGTPGPIRFAINDTDLKEGETATLKIAVAPELLMSGGAFMGAAEQSLGLDVTYGNDTLHIIMGDFNNNWTGPVDWSHFKDFSMVVHGTADTHDHLESSGHWRRHDGRPGDRHHLADRSHHLTRSAAVGFFLTLPPQP